MVQADINKSKNLLIVRHSGHVTEQQTAACVGELERLAVELSPGFQLLTDLSKLETMDLGCVPHIKSLMDICNRKGVETVIRVIPDPKKDIGLNIMSLFHYGPKVHIATCKTLAEAMKLLES